MPLLIVLLLLVSANAGRAPYGIENSTFPCADFFYSVRKAKSLKISFVWHTFRNTKRPGGCLAKVLKDPRLSLLQATLVNETCEHRRDCAGREFLAGQSLDRWSRAFATSREAYVKRYKRFMKGAYAYLLPRLKSPIQCLITPFLESKMRGRGAVNQVRFTREVFGPRCMIGFNPYANRYSEVGQDYTELHGRADPLDVPYIVNLDGEQLDFKNRGFIEYFLEIHRGAIAAFLWTGADNCGGPRRGAPHKRQCSADSNFNLAGRFL